MLCPNTYTQHARTARLAEHSSDEGGATEQAEGHVYAEGASTLLPPAPQLHSFAPL